MSCTMELLTSGMITDGREASCVVLLPDKQIHENGYSSFKFLFWNMKHENLHVNEIYNLKLPRNVTWRLKNITLLRACLSVFVLFTRLENTIFRTFFFVWLYARQFVFLWCRSERPSEFTLLHLGQISSILNDNRLQLLKTGNRNYSCTTCHVKP